MHITPRIAIMANSTIRTGRHEDDDNQDQIGSSGSTPSGIATPQPDLSDKRQPGIMHSYFAQVRLGFGSTSSSTSQRSPASTTPTPPSAPAPAPAPAPVTVDGKKTSTQPRHGEEGEDTSDTSSCSGSIIMVERDQNSDLPPHPSGVGSKELEHEESSRPPNPSLLPTPPPSSACSLLEKEKEVAENGAPAAGNGVGSICRALKNFILPNNSTPALESRRHTSHPVSSVSTVSCPASQISFKPSLPPSLAGSGSLENDPPFPSHDVHHVSKSAGDLSKLTESAVLVPREKNTPPLTPRAMSNENHTHTEKRSTLSTTSSPAPPNRRSDPGNEKRSRKSKEASPSQSSASDGPPVGSLKGKLSVQISEARGLRPSYDPYVVCVFEWNEYISKGASEESVDAEESSKGKKDTLGSVPIRRTDSDSGRPVAIPMKSRQSSNNSQMDNHDQKNSAQVTDPQWNHEAVLFVHPPFLTPLRFYTSLSRWATQSFANNHSVTCSVMRLKSMFPYTIVPARRHFWVT